jgi:hypothetical protein
MKKRRSMFMYGIQCVRCNHEIIAPRKTNSWTIASSVTFGTARNVRHGSNHFLGSPPTQNW